MVTTAHSGHNETDTTLEESGGGFLEALPYIPHQIHVKYEQQIALVSKTHI